jgi:Tol biopolymer transport system component
MISAILVVLLAGGAVFAVVLLLRNKSADKTTAGSAGASASAPPASQAAAPPFPIQTMLVRVDSGGAASGNQKSAIYLLTPGSDKRTKIVDTGGDTLPEWSHQRTQIAETRTVADGNHEIWVLNGDGSNPHKIIGNVTGGRVAWSADDTRLAFVTMVGKYPQLFVITLGESTPRQLTSQNSAKDDPAWSPDGRSIVYWVSVDGVRQLFRLDVADPVEPGRQLTRGSSGPGVDPAWSPDGTEIAYTRGTGPGLSDIWLMNADGSGAHALAKDPAREMDPTFAPDGTWIAFTRGDLDHPKITIVNLAGTEEHVLTKGSAREGHPCWS